MNNISSIEKREMLSNIAAGHAESFTKLFNLLKDSVYSYAMHITRSEYLAEEITQEVFLKIWTNRNMLYEIADVEAWIITITKNLCFNHLKKMAREKEHLRLLQLDNTESAEASTESYLSVKDLLNSISTAVNQLSPQQNLIFRLNRDGGLKNEEIAHQLHLSTNTVKTHMVAALGKIRRFITSQSSDTVLCVCILFKFFFR